MMRTEFISLEMKLKKLKAFDVKTSKVIERYDKLTIYPANMFVTSPDTLQSAIWEIQQDLVKQVDYFKEIGKHLEAKRLEERTNFDLEMIRELGYCSGIENYSRYLDGREAGTRPFCLLDYFPKDYLMVVDESHVTLSQVHACMVATEVEKKTWWNMVSDFPLRWTIVR